MQVLTDENVFKSSYFKNICPGYEQFFEPEKLFLRLTDHSIELKRRQDILRDLLENPKLFEDLCFLSEAVTRFKSALNDLPNHDLGDFRLNLECYNDAAGAVELLKRFYKAIEYVATFPWLNNFAVGVKQLFKRYNAEKTIKVWKQIFIPEFNMHACDFGCNFDNTLWPVSYKLLSMHKQEYTKKNTPYKIEQIKVPLSMLIPATLNGLVNQVIDLDRYSYDDDFLFKVKGYYLFETCAVSDAPNRIKVYIASLIAELEPLVTEFVPYLCAAKTALYWREKGISYCIPVFGKPGEINIQGMINPYIAENEGIEDTVENDLVLNDEIAVVTGANRGGKTAFVTSVTLCQMFFQLGFPIPAKSAKLGLFEGIATVFAGEEQGLIGTGRLGEELKKLAAGLKIAQAGNTFICLNEPLTGTSSSDGKHILAEVLCMLKQAESTGFMVTHLLGLASVLEDLNELNGSPLITLTAQTDGDKPLYKIIPAPPAETSYAKALVNGVMCKSTK